MSFDIFTAVACPTGAAVIGIVNKRPGGAADLISRTRSMYLVFHVSSSGVALPNARSHTHG